jgi:5-methyltetrahydrofolate--homocysteine methyltransferase
MGWEEELRSAVVEGDEIRAEKITMRLMKEGEIPMTILEKGAVEGINEAGRLWEEGTFFLPDMILATEAYSVVSDILEPVLSGCASPLKGTVVIGSVEGDAHEIGKKIVIAMLHCAAYQVEDLGVDVRAADFVERVERLQPVILGLGAYMTTTMRRMGEVIGALEDAGLRDTVKVMLGGAAVTADFAASIGADGYAADAMEAVRLADRWMGVR